MCSILNKRPIRKIHFHTSCITTRDTKNYKSVSMNEESGYSKYWFRATDYNMRRILRGRGGTRRPATPSRSLPSPFRNIQQPAQFTNNTTSNNSNDLQQPTGAFTFGQQGGATSGQNQTNSTFGLTSQSASFPPVAPSSTTFNFSMTEASAVNNPFGIENDTGKYGQDDPVPVPQFGGFQGSLFKLPASTTAPRPPEKAPDPSQAIKKRNSYSRAETDAERELGEQAPQFEAHAPFVWATNQPAPTDLFQSSSNMFGQQTEHKPTTPFANNFFGPTQTQPQQSNNNLFGQNQALPTGNLFGQSLTQPQQSASNPFDQQTQQSSNSIFQQQSQQPNNNIFEQQHDASQTKNNAFGQTPQQSNGNTFEQQQHSQHPKSNIFNQNSQQPNSNIFGQQPQQPSSNIFGQQPQQPSSNVFGQQSQRWGSNMFEQKSQKSKASVTQAEEPLSVPSADSQPDIANRPAGPFASLDALTAPADVHNPMIQRQGSSLFDRITKHPDGLASSAGDGQKSSQVSSQHEPKNTQVREGSLFDQISKPLTEVIPDSAPVSDPHGLVLAKPVYAGSSTSPTRSPPRPQLNGTFFTASQESIATSHFNVPNLQDGKSAASNVPGTSQSSLASNSSFPSSSSLSSVPTKVNTQDRETNSHNTAIDGKSSTFTMPRPTNGRVIGVPPDPPAEFTAEQKRHLVIGYRLKALDLGIQKHVKKYSNSPKELEVVRRFYRERVQAIYDAGDMPPKQIAGKKRKPVSDTQRKAAPNKRAKLDTLSSHEPKPHPTVSNGPNMNGDTFSKSPNRQSMPAKRKPEGDMDKTAGQGPTDSTKQTHGERKIAYPSLSSSTSNSQTSSIFKNVLGAKEQPLTAGGPGNVTAPDAKLRFTTTQSSFQSKASSTSRSPGPLRKSPSLPKEAPKVSLPPSSESVSQSPSKPAMAPRVQPSASAKANPFSVKPNSTGPPPKTLFAPLAQSSLNITATPAPVTAGSTKATFSAVDKPPTFEIPKFGIGAPSNFLPQFGKTAEDTAKKAKEKRKAEDFDSDEDNEAEWERKDAEEQRAKKQKLENTLMPKKARLIPGKGFVFSDDDAEKIHEKEATPRAAGQDLLKPSVPSASLSASKSAAQGVVNSHNMFGHLTDLDSGAESSKTGDADDEDDGSEGEIDSGKDYDQKVMIEGAQRTSSQQKDAKPSEEAASSANNNSFAAVNGRWSQPPGISSGEAQSSGRSLFDRITRDDSGSAIKEIQPAEEKRSESTASEPSNFQTTTSIFSQAPSIGSGSTLFSQSSSAKSLFSDLGSSASSKPNSNPFGQSSAPASVLTPSKQSSNMFGQSSSFTPGSSLSKPSFNIFGQPPPGTDSGKSEGSPQGDHTWKPDTPIKFGSMTNAPGVTVTSPTPSKPSFGGLFGAPQATASTETPDKPASSIFGNTPAKSTSAAFGFAFGGPPKTASSTLAPSFGVASNTTSRATSPGATTTGESANESAADGDDVVEHHEQLDLSSVGPGEEDEDVIFEVKAKALSFNPSSKIWDSKGVGLLRVLSHRETSKTRMVLRQATIGKVILNVALLSNMKYDYAGSKAVKMAVPSDSGKLEMWMVRTGTDEDAKKLSAVLEEKKVN